MFYDLSEVLTRDEISFIEALIQKVKSSSIDGYNFNEETMSKVEENVPESHNIISSLISKQIIKIQTLNICSICGNDIDYCFCDDSKISTTRYFYIDREELISYILRTIERMYNIKLVNKVDNNMFINAIFKGDMAEIEIYFYFQKLTQEFLKSNVVNDRIILSLMPIDLYNVERNILEWNEMIISENLENIKELMRDLNIIIKSKNFYNIDLGDDIEVDDVERARDTIREYFINNGFSNHTEVAKYKPEMLDYSLPIEKIKECFIKEDYKIIVIKPLAREISIAYFKNNIINSDDYLYETVKTIDSFIKEKSQKLRNLKNGKKNATLVEKVIQLFAPCINILSVVIGMISKNKLFTYINDFVTSKVIIYIFLIVNLLSVAAMVYFSIIPYIKLRNFDWSRGLNKMKR